MIRRTLKAVSARESAHADHATKEAARPLILPIPRPPLLAPSATTPLYPKITCHVLRKPLRGPVSRAVMRKGLNLPHNRSNLVGGRTIAGL